MLKIATATSGIDSGGASWARLCDACRSAACTVYCRADSAYLCAGCDARVHVASRHERVWVCEACERAPAAFLCKADAASLCSSCDADIHSANPLAGRHHRVPVLPISGCPFEPSSTQLGAHGGEVVVEEEKGGADEDDDVDDEAEAASWLLQNPVNSKNDNNRSNGYLFSGEVDEYLDLVDVDCNSCEHNRLRYDHQQQYQQQRNYSGVPQKSYAGDSVVPIQCNGGEVTTQMQHQQAQQFQQGLDFDSSKPGFTYSGSLSQSVSISSMDVGVVPESTISDVSISHSRPPKGTIDIFSGTPIQMPSYFTPVDREARVLRYREKKKTRKFEKTIRYASRKAYAETRPRIKGRFAKRTDIEAEVYQMFTTTLMTEAGYGAVPSF